MKIIPGEILSSIRGTFPFNLKNQKFFQETPPFRSELFSEEQMKEFGKVLATRHKVLEGRAPNTLLKRLADNEEILLEVHGILTESVRNKQRIIPAGEWLLDNFYLIQEQIRTGKRHLPKGYNENLPRILNEQQINIPRVYDIAINIIAHSDGRLSAQNLYSFIHSYEEITSLKMGELWAIPIMLRLALIENLRRISSQIASDRMHQNLADYWAIQMVKTAESDPKSLIMVISDMARSKPPLVSSFVAELTRQLHGKGPSLALTLNWIEQVLSETGQTSEELIHQEFQKQAADQVSMSNSIGSLRFLGTMNWQDFVEDQSIVEQTLRKETSGIYPSMDFETRDHYRHQIEKMAKDSGIKESFIAQTTLRLSEKANENNPLDLRSAHVGYYLIDEGRKELLKEIVYPENFLDTLRMFFKANPLFIYLSTIFSISIGLALIWLSRAYWMGTGALGLWVIGLLCFLCTSHLVIKVLNWAITQVIKPQVLPRMDYESGVHPDFSTMVIIPGMINGIKSIESLIETLLVHYLANKDSHIYFGLLTDFRDAPQEVELEDQFFIDFTREKINELNTQYDIHLTGKFYWFHRPRKWNTKENIWMGFERKRGKLTEFNNLIRGESENCFNVVLGEKKIFPEIKLIITLDSDTQLPRDSARKMIGSMAHPLNRPVFDEKKQRVTRGYGILQPRVSLSLLGSSNSLFARMQGNDLGIDPYSKSTSDVYQDLFQEGSFIGKGIYDLDMFRKCLNNTFPENRILSHDLLEGCYTRSGLLSDVELYEEYPPRYQEDVNRRYRWIRGDWQIASWVLPWVPKVDKGYMHNPISGLSKWKIMDNLRRSLVSPAIILLLILGWTRMHDAWFWTLTISLTLILPSTIKAFKDLLFKNKEIVLRQHFNDSISSVLDDVLQNIFMITCLPFEAFYSLKAIGVTLFRVWFSHRHLLVWNPSPIRWSTKKESLVHLYRVMAISPVLGFAGLIYLSIYSALDHFIADPILLSWIASPFIAWFISRPIISHQESLNPAQILYLRKIARKTWGYFETFSTETDNWLFPDNFQEHPEAKIAHRTSPTNLGLGLLSTLAAVDFGFITQSRFINQVQNTLDTLYKMERYKGHFYNWYDTQTLTPLPPRYISTVDSGNFAGLVITLRNGILRKIHEPVIGPHLFKGLKDTLNTFREFSGTTTHYKLFEKNLDAILEIEGTGSMEKSLPHLMVEAELLYSLQGRDPYSTVGMGTKSLVQQCRDMEAELFDLFPDFSEAQIPELFKEIWSYSHSFSLKNIAELPKKCWDLKTEFQKELSLEEEEIIEDFLKGIEKSGKNAQLQIEKLMQMEKETLDLSRIDFDFLYDKDQALFSIGYNIDEHRRDIGFYDLLASEARLATFIAISQNKIPQESWFSLGRQLTHSGGVSILLSWSGSMFEYLMPLLIMPTYPNTILDQTYHSMVQRQIDYGKQLGVPWGISESGYNLVDTNLNYQYRAFGVPELGLKRGLGEDLVVAPYASVMALMVDPKESYKNLETLKDLDMEGGFGFYEAIDYTPSRLPRGQNSVVIRSFMAHHQGMSLLSLAYFLLDKPMQKRFEAEAEFQASLLLLQERIPKSIKFFTPPPDVADINPVPEDSVLRVVKGHDGIVPEIQLISNGTYHVMVTGSGSGYSRYKNIALTRWHEDTTRENWGSFCYIKDLEKGQYFSAGFQPSLKDSPYYEAVFSQGRAEFKRQDLDLEVHTEIVVSPEDDIEIRRVRISNRSRRSRSLALTTYAEVVMATAISDELHPAFSNLFVETEILETKNALLCTRRPRTEEEKNIWFFHVLKCDSREIQKISFETDRLEFIGRTKNLENPEAMQQSQGLSGTAGPVLDPIVSIQNQFKMGPLETLTFDLIFGVGETRVQAENLINKYQDNSFIERSFELAWTHNQVILRQINATESDAQLYEKLAGSIIFSNSSLRAESSIILTNKRGQSGLWGYSISGDVPILLLRISSQENIELVKKMIQAQSYWRLKGLIVDLVIWNEEHSDYRQVLQNQIIALTSDGMGKESMEKPGGIFVRVVEQISPEDRVLMQTVARIEISDQKGTLSYQVNKKAIQKNPIPNILPLQPPQAKTFIQIPSPIVMETNGFGGFSKNGKEYIMNLGMHKITPMPWVNVLANADFGTIISESGQAYTWAVNAHEFRLSPWENDPVTDASGEAFYLRDDESGDFWSPSPLPCPSQTNYIVRHGFGYSSFEHQEDGIHSEMLEYVDLEESIKFIVLKIKNKSGRARRLSATGYVEWVLGDLRSKNSMFVVTEIDENSGGLFARNLYNKDFNDHRVAFFDVNDSSRTFTGDRMEFIGRNKSLRSPEAMEKVRLSKKVGAALDPCGALQSSFYLSDQEDHEVVFLLGTSHNAELASDLLTKMKTRGESGNALNRVKDFWEKTLGSVSLESKDLGMNYLTNGWLVYQTLASRFWGRSGYYQSGGAYGFRDQIQDSMALVSILPNLARRHILLCASRQFKEGDVQHWWHPPGGRGVRTRCSDDFLWLVFATCRYIRLTQDYAILQEPVSFVEGRILNPGEESYYDQVSISNEKSSLYDHCIRAIRNGLKLGIHNLPLMGSGDWNDGMDRVGMEGKGESVWLAFFQFEILNDFAKISLNEKDTLFANFCLGEANKMQVEIEKNAWDGNWYKRAFYDDHSPLGSKENVDCQIDSLTQSWSVLSGSGNRERALKGMDSVYLKLVNKEFNLIQLLDPPFDKGPKNPGYIKGYVPGIRENGGQYTHAAIWMVMAFAKLKNREKAWELFSMINPVHHGNSEEKIGIYKVEPYVVAADVYKDSLHSGRGGWTWYTGSAGWMYRLVTESLLGLYREGDCLVPEPCLPEALGNFAMTYRFKATVYTIQYRLVDHDEETRTGFIQSSPGKVLLRLDGLILETNSILLIDDTLPHVIDMLIPPETSFNPDFSS